MDIYECIVEQTITAPAAYIALSAIPSDYADLVIKFYGAIDGPSGELDDSDPNVCITINWDTGNNYWWLAVTPGYGVDYSEAYEPHMAVTAITEDRLEGELGPNELHGAEIELYNCSANSPTSMYAVGTAGLTGGGYGLSQAGGVYTVSAPVTSIQLFLRAHYYGSHDDVPQLFCTGTTVALYGIRK